jgi:hypothetical protein
MPPFIPLPSNSRYIQMHIPLSLRRGGQPLPAKSLLTGEVSMNAHSNIISRSPDIYRDKVNTTSLRSLHLCDRCEKPKT